MMRFATSVLCLTVLLLVSTASATAALSPEVKAELSALTKELKTVTSLIRKKQVDEARTLVQKATDRFKELKIDEGERDRTLSAFQTSLKRATGQLPVSFEQHVAPILKDNCLSCHSGNNARAGLRLDTFAAIRVGNQAKPFIVPRAPARSLLYARVSTQNAQLRMPKNQPALDVADAETIGRWILQGAPYDGTDASAPIGSSMTASAEAKQKVKVVMADGSETVSFRKDIAPWMVNVCMNCHTGNNARNGYKLTTFEDVLTDGETGSTIVPGDPDSSYIVDLVLRQDPLKMPAGNQTRLKRSQAQLLEKWIKEGAHFDGTDPKAAIRSLVPTAAELASQALASMSIEDFEQRRREQADSIWKQVNPREESDSVETKDLIVYGNLAQSRLQELADAGQAQVAVLADKYKLKGSPWRGRLIVFATKARFGYEEFNTVLMNNRRTPRGVSGHVSVTANVDNAYIAMHDIGDAASIDRLAAKPLLNAMIAQAFLTRNGQSIPDWLQQGFGILESGENPDSKYLKQIPLLARSAITSISNPATLFDNGTFAPGEVDAVGYLLTRFLINRGGIAKLNRLIGQLQTSRNAGRAIQQTYGTSAADLGRAFLQSGG
ncbi:MAG: c-type cytochrome domain-containing protein [Fuerstiella sp.]